MELLPGTGAKRGRMAGTTDTFLRLGWTQTWFYRVSLAVQGLRLPTPTAGGTGSIPGQGTKIPHREFSGGPGVKNLPANAGNMVSFPGLGRSHMLRAAKAVSHNYAPTQGNYWSPGALEPVLRNKRRHRSEKPEHCNSRVTPTHLQLEKACTKQCRPSAAKNK